MSGYEDEEGFRDDPEARALARRLAETDFSAETRARAVLRVRLAAGRRSDAAVARAARPAAALTFAAALVVFALPFLTPEAPEPGPSFPRGPEGLPVLPGRLPAAADAPGAAPFEAVSARVVEGAGARSVSWRVGGATYVLESRRTSLDEIFVRRSF